MNNRYLYRAKRIDNRKWIFGNYLHTDDGDYIIQNHVPYSLLTNYMVDPSTICQYTGLTEKNGKKIWENDIAKLVLPDGEIRYFKVSFKKVIRKVLCHPDFDDDVAKVELNAICFEWNGYELFPCVDTYGVPDYQMMEVVGNVFDNADLLEGGAE